MRSYETMVIVNQSIENEELVSVAKRIEEFILKEKGTEISHEVMGKKRLAYMVDKERYGTYVMFQYKAESNFIRVLDNFLKFTEPVIKYITVNREQA